MAKESEEEQFLKLIEEKEKRKLKAKQKKEMTVWQQLGTFGLVGWSIVFPVLFGTFIGWIIDKKQSHGHHFWTLTLLIVGLMLGCWNACYWVFQEYKEIEKDHNTKSDG